MIKQNTTDLLSILDDVNTLPDIYDARSYIEKTLTKCSSKKIINIKEHSFEECQNLSIVNFINAISIGKSAFNNCTSLTSADFPACTSIGDGAFSRCSSLTSISFPACTSIDDGAFCKCTSLTSISFPTCTNIGDYAFLDCLSLTTASFPTCTSIGYSAFYNCASLKSLYLIGLSLCNLAGITAFNSTPIASGTGKIYVPLSMLSSYKAANNWAHFSSQIYGV